MGSIRLLYLQRRSIGVITTLRRQIIKQAQYAILVLAILLMPNRNAYSEDNNTCDKSYYQYIVSNFKSAYKNLDKFWLTLHCCEKKVLHGDESKISEILELSGIGEHNSEFTEWYSELIEKSFVMHHAKYMKALQKVNIKKAKQIIEIIKYPIFEDPQKTNRILSIYSKDKRYRKLFSVQ